ncbi:MAG: murein transglycosylase A [Rhodoplanes sp.]|jgi:membrane-bound lytic murein transglycosylase A
MSAVLLRGVSLAAALALILGAAGPVEAARRGSANAGRQAETPMTDPQRAEEPGPLQIPDSQLEPIDFAELPDWAGDDHASAFAAFLASCRPIVRTTAPDARPVLPALVSVCRRALAAAKSLQGDGDKARLFFEQNFRPLRIAKLGESAGFLTGYYEPIVDGSRFPTRIFSVPVYRRPPDLVAPGAPPKASFPNRGRVVRITSTGDSVPYFDRGEIEDGALDGQHLEICWLKDPAELLTIQIQGSARVRLEDGAMLRINYDAHNGYPYTAVGRVLIERNIIPREEMSMARIRDWMAANPEDAKEVRRQNRSYVFFRIVGLIDDREPVGGQGVRLTPGRSIAVDRALHVYGTPFYIEADLPLAGARSADPFRRTMIAQDTGSAIVGPARADLYFGAGDDAGRVAGRIRQAGRFAMLVPREIDPVAAGARMPLPQVRPPPEPEKPTNTVRRAKRKALPASSRKIRRSRTIYW